MQIYCWTTCYIFCLIKTNSTPFGQTQTSTTGFGFSQPASSTASTGLFGSKPVTSGFGAFGTTPATSTFGIVLFWVILKSIFVFYLIIF